MRIAQSTLIALLGLACAAPEALAQARERLPSPTPDPSRHLPVPSTGPSSSQMPSLDSVGEIQARSRLQTDGFDNVTTLIRDAAGLWRGKANRGGITFDVAVDPNGNVTVQ